MLVRIRHPEKLIYPESDGQPMGENTQQFQWIITLFHGIENLFFARKDVFVADDLFWFPKKGDPTTVMAPDIMAVFGRPKGHRGSYKQWEEGGIAPQVAIELQSPSNTEKASKEKRLFYSKYGVEEFYNYDPETNQLEVWMRSGGKLRQVKEAPSYTSPRMGVRFELPGDEPLSVIRPDGRPFLTYDEMITAAQVEQERAIEERKRAQKASLRAEKLAAKLRELGVDPDGV